MKRSRFKGMAHPLMVLSVWWAGVLKKAMYMGYIMAQTGGKVFCSLRRQSQIKLGVWGWHPREIDFVI